MKYEKLIKRALGIFFSAVFLGIVALNAYIMICGVRGKTASVFGRSLLKITTGSMEPSIYAGDYIIVKKISPDKLKEGDIISFYSTDDDIYGNINTHRIIGFEEGGFVTKGDANPTSDPTIVPPQNIIGKYTGKSRFIEWLDSVTSIKRLVVLTAIIVALTFIVYSAGSIIRIRLEAERLNAAEIKQQLIRDAVEAEKQKLREQAAPAEEVKTDEPREDNEEEDVHCDSD